MAYSFDKHKTATSQNKIQTAKEAILDAIIDKVGSDNAQFLEIKELESVTNILLKLEPTMNVGDAENELHKLIEGSTMPNIKVLSQDTANSPYDSMEYIDVEDEDGYIVKYKDDEDAA